MRAIHLQFTDDTLFFSSQNSPYDLQNFKPLMINLDKSSLLGINLNQDQVWPLPFLLNFGVLDWYPI